MRQFRGVACAITCFVLAAGTARAAGSSSTPASAPGLQFIIEHYATSLGGRDLLSRITTQSAIYSFTLAGHAMLVTTTVEAPAYYLQVVQPEGGAVELKEGFDGKLAWLQDASGIVHLLSGRARAELITQAVGANDSELFPERWPTTVTLQPAETINGKQYYVLSILPKDGVAHDVILDAQSFKPVMDRSVEAEVTSTSTVNSFGAGPLGELFPLSVITTRSDGVTVTSILRDVKDNVPVSKSLFSPPASRGTETI